MSTSGVLLGAAGALQTIEHAGRVYRVGRLTEGAKDAFSAWMIGRARRLIMALYTHDEAEQKRHLDELTREVMEGVYDFHDELCLGRPGPSGPDGKPTLVGGLVHTRGGMLALTAILCDCSQEEALALMVARRTELLHLLGLSLAESLPGIKLGEPEGNVRPG